MPKLYTDEELEKIKCKYEKILTKAYLKNNDKKAEAYRLKFLDKFYQSQLFQDTPLKETYHVVFSDPNKDCNHVEISITKGRILTDAEYFNVCNGLPIEKEEPTIEKIQEIFDI